MKIDTIFGVLDILDTKGATKYLRVSKQAIQKAAAKGRIRGYQFPDSKAWIFFKIDLDQYKSALALQDETFYSRVAREAAEERVANELHRSKINIDDIL